MDTRSSQWVVKSCERLKRVVVSRGELRGAEEVLWRAEMGYGGRLESCEWPFSVVEDYQRVVEVLQQGCDGSSDG